MTSYSAFGTALGIGDGNSVEVFTAIAQIGNISGPGMSADTIDVTTHSSTDGYRQFVQGLKDAGEITFDLLFDPVAATHKNAAGGLQYLFEQGTANNFQISWTDAATTKLVFPGIVTGFSWEQPIDDALRASCTIKVSGKPTLV